MADFFGHLYRNWTRERHLRSFDDYVNAARARLSTLGIAATDITMLNSPIFELQFTDSKGERRFFHIRDGYVVWGIIQKVRLQ